MPDRPNLAQSPFHPGEQAAQDRQGVRDRMEMFGRKVIRDHMPDEHREFYGQLPFVLLGAVDGQGRPWASLIAGGAGFIASPDPHRLEIGAHPPMGDPIGAALFAGADVGLLGIELETRRRNRMNGRIDAIEAQGMAVEVDQAFGNCPKYIQTRAVTYLPERAAANNLPDAVPLDHFDAGTRALLERSDTLFIATAVTADQAGQGHGADISHRGGKPGFVRIEGDREFSFPDYFGNNHFNTIGNILLNPKAGILFVDFEAGDLVSMTGAAEIVWDGPQVEAIPGAQRLVRFRAEQVVRLPGRLPFAFEFGDYPPIFARLEKRR
jgi:predicted pyridoxine 5'-phosphate oxidase superfamily flavin-nucleotide-binding protein